MFAFFWPSFLLLNIDPREIKAYVPQKTCTQMITESLRGQPKLEMLCESTGKRMVEQARTPHSAYRLVTRKKESVIHEESRQDWVGSRSQRQRRAKCVIPFTGNPIIGRINPWWQSRAEVVWRGARKVLGRPDRSDAQASSHMYQNSPSCENSVCKLYLNKVEF